MTPDLVIQGSLGYLGRSVSPADLAARLSPASAAPQSRDPWAGAQRTRNAARAAAAAAVPRAWHRGRALGLGESDAGALAVSEGLGNIFKKIQEAVTGVRNIAVSVVGGVASVVGAVTNPQAAAVAAAQQEIAQQQIAAAEAAQKRDHDLALAVAKANAERSSGGAVLAQTSANLSDWFSRNKLLVAGGGGLLLLAVLLRR